MTTLRAKTPPQRVEGGVPSKSIIQASRVPVLVTGASGFAGGHLALRLRSLGQPVRAMVRPGSYVPKLRAAGITLIEGDLRNRDDVFRAAEGVRRIYHLGAVFRAAAIPDSLYQEVNVNGTEHILEAAGRHGVERTIHCSTVAIHREIKELPCDEDSPLNAVDIYQKTKLQGELRARAAITQGLPVVIVRPAGIYGPGDLRFLKLFQAIYQRRFRMFGSGETLWQGIYVDDLVDGILLCAEHPNACGQTYFLAEERHATLNQVADAIANAVGAPAPKGHLPYWPLAAGAALCEALCRPLGIEPPLHRRRAAFFSAFSIHKAQQELGYAPKVSLAEGLRRTVRWYLEHGYLPPRAA